jgi:class 3 adenylate cyclase
MDEKERHYNTTVMFIDMAGYTAKTAKLSRKELQDTLEEFEKVVKPVVKNFGGKIIKGMGDAFLITFHSPTNSVLCGIEIQKRIEDRNQNVGVKDKFEARVGVSSGEVYERGGDIFGEPVNIASRVQSLADAGQVIFSDSTFHAMNKNEFSIINLGKKALKGINEKKEIFLAHEKGKPAHRSKIKRFFKKFKSKKVWIPLVIILFLLIVAANNTEKLKENWTGEAHAALEKEDYRTMKKLIDIYEKEPDEWKDFEKRMLASGMYLKIGDRDKAISELLETYWTGNQEEKEEIKRIVREKELNIPEILQEINE